MSRVKGARDKKKRKARSDRKHKYVNRNGKMVRYVPKRSRSDPLKIWFWEVRPMSKEGYHNWNAKFRSRLHTTVYCPLLRVDVPAERLRNKEQIGQVAIEAIGYPGSFMMKMFSHARSKTHCTARRVADIKIIETSEGLRADVSNTWRLGKYWFFEGRS